jgi:hypothetical protein
MKMDMWISGVGNKIKRISCMFTIAGRNEKADLLNSSRKD